MQEMMKKRAKELLASGEVTRVIGWKKNEFDYDNKKILEYMWILQ